MKNKKLLTLILILSLCFMPSAKALYTDASVGTYEQELAKFPCDYQTKIRALHNIYPNAVFVAQNLFFDWSSYKEVPVKWSDMLSYETGSYSERNWISPNAASKFRTNQCRQGCEWYLASEEAVKYYMNPYNFLDEKYVFMFESQLFNTYQTESGVKNILQSTFMADDAICPQSNNKTYAAVIMEAAKSNDVSPYMLASRLRQENGRGTSQLVTGYNGYYNYFNIGASGKNTNEIYQNGYNRAKSEGWDTPYKSIMGGAKFIRQQYIGANDTYGKKGQLTGYLQKWDPYGPKLGNNYYMQNIEATPNEAASTYNSYKSTSGYKSYRYVFYIPIYVGAPNTGGNCSSASTSSSSSSTSSVKTGDLTGDSKIDKKDLLLIQSYVFGYSKLNSNQSKAADVNKDGKVDKKDLLKIQSHVFGYSKIS